MMYYVSLFSGIEAATVAWEPLGWRPVCFSEIDEFPSAVLAERYPDVPNLGDVKRVDWSVLHGQVDLVVGGSPCQSFSIAGNREGLEGESGLMWEYVRAVREIRPEWCVWENVPGALSSSDGEDFGCLLRSLDALGYGLAWRVLDAQFFGVAQRRERLFLVGRLGDPEGPCEVLFEPESLSWSAESSRKKRQALAAGAGGGAEASGFRWHQGSGAGAIGFEREQSPTLDTVKPPTIIDLTGGEAQSSRVYSSDGIAPSLRAHESGGNDLKVLCMADAQPHSMVDPEVCGALTATMHKDPPAVGFAANQRGEVRLQGGDGEVTGAIPASSSGKQVNGVVDGYAVRRLTPRECERLQGFPDDWTRVPYKGKPADECPDTPRYKAIGNSMAVPVMRWIGERIQEVCHEEDQVPVPGGD